VASCSRSDRPALFVEREDNAFGGFAKAAGESAATRSYSKQLLNHLPVCGTLLFTHSLRINVHRRGNVGVPQQFLLHFHMLSIPLRGSNPPPQP
jgi:hypothetical protein